ncbi:hypothetical protein [Streptomyces sp. NPDC006285]|uniref:hypothetical protein n=1 Tax=Streptomyces sp. NPDC006285 TaxID=3364742 RepID=UPI0036B53E03
MTEALINQPVTREAGTPLDPPAEYTRLREDQPIVEVRFPNGSTGWLVTRFEEGSQVFTDPRLSARRPAPAPRHPPRARSPRPAKTPPSTPAS